ncbi:MAG TPA: N-acetylmuramoyl-L-alanine amidase family protein [Candidatus Avilachnospira avistercoris]|nr:N-acetylmuramoyl-L-alanine amidase family protein [Candidatus Avilachnospira avistercoris]
MKKIRFIIITLALLIIGTFSSYAYYERIKPIPSVRVTINTADLSTGDSLSGDAESYVSVALDNQYYYLESAEWLDDTSMLRVGDQPRVKIYLYALPKETSSSAGTTIYLFRGAYNSNNVHVSKGEFISAATRDSGYTLEITVRLDPVRGTYEQPIEAYWSSQRGVAIWDGGRYSSGYYDITCYRGSAVVKRLTNFHGTTYNFYPYMTREGDYSFRVRSVAPPSISTSIGKRSEWTESNSMYIEASQVSDGSGQTTADENGGSSSTSAATGNLLPNGTGNTSAAGWIQVGNTWYFRYPNGSLITNDWLTINGKRYRFDNTGKMLTGWYQDERGQWYYLDPTNGDMRIGWVHDDGKWYFMNNTPDAFYGCMIGNMWWEVNGNRYYFNESGAMVTGWYQIDGKFYYFYPEGSTGGAYGYLARSTVIDGVFMVDSTGAWVQG